MTTTYSYSTENVALANAEDLIQLKGLYFNVDLELDLDL